jgi:excisionase family DNA binding protein
MTDERLMDIKEVAEYLHLTESTIYSWVQDGILPAFRVGRLWRFRRTELDDWLEANRNIGSSTSSRFDVDK